MSYIKQCTQTINDLNRHTVTSLSEKTRLNLSGLIVMSLSSVLLKTDGSLTRSIDLITTFLTQYTDYDVAVKPLIYRFLDRLRNYKEPLNDSLTSSVGGMTGSGVPDYSLPSLPSAYLEGRETVEIEDLLVNREFEKLFFITNFLSHVDSSAPLIRESELESAEIRQISLFSPPKTHISSRKSKQSLPVIEHTKYLNFFKQIISKSKGRISPEAVLESSKRGLKGENRSISERRTASLTGRRHVTPVGERYVAPNMAILKEVERKKTSLVRVRRRVENWQREAIGRRRPKENIMVEFDPSLQGSTSLEVALNPVSIPTALPRAKSRLHRKKNSSFDSLI